MPSTNAVLAHASHVVGVRAQEPAGKASNVVCTVQYIKTFPDTPEWAHCLLTPKAGSSMQGNTVWSVLNRAYEHPGMTHSRRSCQRLALPSCAVSRDRAYSPTIGVQYEGTAVRTVYSHLSCQWH